MMTRTALGHEEGCGGIMNSTLFGAMIGRGGPVALFSQQRRGLGASI
jgi:hypothetical protein